MLVLLQMPACHFQGQSDGGFASGGYDRSHMVFREISLGAKRPRSFDIQRLLQVVEMTKRRLHVAAEKSERAGQYVKPGAGENFFVQKIFQMLQLAGDQKYRSQIIRQILIRVFFVFGGEVLDNAIDIPQARRANQGGARNRRIPRFRWKSLRHRWEKILRKQRLHVGLECGFVNASVVVLHANERGVAKITVHAIEFTIKIPPISVSAGVAHRHQHLVSLPEGCDVDGYDMRPQLRVGNVIAAVFVVRYEFSLKQRVNGRLHFIHPLRLSLHA